MASVHSAVGDETHKPTKNNFNRREGTSSYFLQIDGGFKRDVRGYKPSYGRKGRKGRAK